MYGSQVKPMLGRRSFAAHKEKMKYIIASSDFNPNSINPYEENGLYTSYSCFSTNGNTKYDLITKRTNSGCWLVKYNKNNYQDHIYDFIKYENINGRIVIIQTEYIDEVTTIIDKNITSIIPGILVHSTSLEASSEISKEMKIKALKYLEKNNRSIGTKIVKYQINEPEEYSEYIMLGEVEGNTELVMAMYQRDTFNTTENDLYKPGARIYLDSKKMDNDGLIIRDGIHIGKVHKEIDLSKYCIKIITANEFPFGEEWTPKKFRDACNSVINNCLTIASTG